MSSKEQDSSLEYFRRVGAPVFAEASAPGGPVCILRVSGYNLDFLSGLFPKGLPKNRIATYSTVAGVDKALLIFFKGPHSFTGEDVLEIQGHGVPSLVNAIKSQLRTLGAKDALPGEFSFRAFLNGKMTIEDAQFLNDAFSMENLSHKGASTLLGFNEGHRKKAQEKFQELLTSLFSARGRVESSIDFSEAEEEQAQDVESALSYLIKVEDELQLMLNLHSNFAANMKLPTVCIVGEPNAGKSTLFNLLAGVERSLVSETKGTTRDYLELGVRIANRSIKLVDTAGLRVVDSDNSHSKLEKMGIDKGLEVVKNAQLLLWVKASETENLDQWITREQIPILEVVSHGDVNGISGALNLKEKSSALELSKMLHAKLEEIAPSLAENEDLVLSSRQFQLLERTAECIEQSKKCLAGEMPIELAAQNLQDAEKLLKQCIGEELGEEYISQIFSQFCLGK